MCICVRKVAPKRHRNRLEKRAYHVHAFQATSLCQYEIDFLLPSTLHTIYLTDYTKITLLNLFVILEH